MEFYDAWIEHCQAAVDIKGQFGAKAAFDYIVLEKLLQYMRVAAENPDFARELPRFIAEVRRIFTVDEVKTNIARLHLLWQTLDQNISPATHTNDNVPGKEAESAKQLRLFAVIQELLTVPDLGTS